MPTMDDIMLAPRSRRPRRFLLLPSLLAALVLSALTSGWTDAQPIKPNIWVYSDLTDPRNQRDGGHPKGDPDDLASLASLLLSADRFHIESIVVGSGSFPEISNPVEMIEDIFVPAYEAHLQGLADPDHPYQPEIQFQWSSVTSAGRVNKFQKSRSYEDLSDFETVSSLVEYATDHEVYVLVWGALTEPAILVKHLQTTGNRAALDNITIVSHWSKSYVMSMHQEELKTDPFAVTNCRMDRDACMYVHEQAAQGNVKLVQLGSVGQTGIVDGSINYPRIQAFAENPLGQIFMSAKSYNNKQDQSDAATYWVFASDLGFDLKRYPTNGDLTRAMEEQRIEKFKALAPAVMDNLLDRAQASEAEPFPDSFVADYFTYAYYRWGHYAVYVPAAVPYRILSPDGEVLLEGEFKQWRNPVDLPKQPQGHYRVELLFPDKTVVKPL
ncbi:nucleoside hydrolase-like domain-containing protein [Algisphaera agarilytica]|uniref:Cellulose-binding Sde182 nucleoside hydrolase-like domain-containing protein n=1 Tax=Algisphaera agarilytica TaxID=1385975 RepID=A0A7X0H8N2_9BACT|nr:nucleoside hydrolase-like domain-containing protein [Algisphaera agarilytica]MBB6431158.1 hypothetical protein [Algisphaera agarilytica]